VASDALIEAVFAEDAEGGGEASLEIVALLVFVVELWRATSSLSAAVSLAMVVVDDTDPGKACILP
jgi:hypothetical protein